MLLVAPGGPSDPILAASFRDGAWNAGELTAPAAGIRTDSGGGLAVTGVDRGVVVLRGDSDTGLYGASFTGTWSSLTRLGTARSTNVSAPAPVTGGALLTVHDLGASGTDLHFGRYDDVLGAWSVLDETTGAQTANRYGPPAIVADAAGAALILFDPPAETSYRSITNAGGSWGLAQDIPNAPVPPGTLARGIAAVRRAGSDQIVAALRSGTANELRVAVLSLIHI